MFVTPLDERDVLEFKPNGCKSGDMSPVAKLGKIDGHQNLFAGSIPGLWASTNHCYGQSK